jgi:uncharacterized small protein (DUF1192 family)
LQLEIEEEVRVGVELLLLRQALADTEFALSRERAQSVGTIAALDAEISIYQEASDRRELETRQREQLTAALEIAIDGIDGPQQEPPVTVVEEEAVSVPGPPPITTTDAPEKEMQQQDPPHRLVAAAYEEKSVAEAQCALLREEIERLRGDVARANKRAEEVWEEAKRDVGAVQGVLAQLHFMGFVGNEPG